VLRLLTMSPLAIELIHVLEVVVHGAEGKVGHVGTTNNHEPAVSNNVTAKVELSHEALLLGVLVVQLVTELRENRIILGLNLLNVLVNGLGRSAEGPESLKLLRVSDALLELLELFAIVGIGEFKVSLDLSIGELRRRVRRVKDISVGRVEVVVRAVKMNVVVVEVTNSGSGTATTEANLVHKNRLVSALAKSSRNTSGEHFLNAETKTVKIRKTRNS
jgi:hypothetical protein